MAIDTSLLTVAPSLQQLFRDKDTGLPLVGGKVHFYADTSRSTEQPVYGIVGSPPNYTYSALSNPVTLNGVGAFPETIYYYPYDADGNLSLYYIEVYDSTDTIFQFSVEGYPLIDATGGPDDLAVINNNYIPNGQFTYHNYIPATDTSVAGQITQALTPIAPGGHYFQSADYATAVQLVTFSSFPDYSDSPPATPRYSLDINQSGTVAGINQYIIRFNNVNRFSSSTQKYTISFYGQNNGVGNLDIDFRLYKYYGTGGSPYTETDVNNFRLDSDMSPFFFSFVFGPNTGKTIVSDDSYVDLVFRLPLSNLNISLTNMMLVQGEVANADYPVTTTSQDAYRGVAGGLPLPASDGSSLFLPIIYKETGFDFDDSQIGNIEIVSYETVPLDSNNIPTTNRLINDGSSYNAESYSLLNIPYSRLRDALYDSTLKALRYGTGKDFVTATITDTNNLLFVNNTGGVATITDVATGATGFTFRESSVSAAAFAVKSAMSSATTIICTLNNARVYDGSYVWSCPAGSFTVTADVRNSSTTATLNVYTITCVAAASITSGTDYIQCYDQNAAPGAFFVWFSVNGAGSAPAGTGTAIRVNVETGDSAAIVTQKTVAAFMQKEGSFITTTAATLLNNKYFTFTAKTQSSTQLWAVWYNVDSGGTQPAVAGSPNYIEVAVAVGDTSAQVADKTRIAINKRMVGVPDPRGMFLRIYDGGAATDPSVATRFDYQNPFLYGDYIGTYELDGNLSHNHSTALGPNVVSGYAPHQYASGSDYYAQDTTITYDGGAETVTRNFYVNTAIIY